MEQIPNERLSRLPEPQDPKFIDHLYMGDDDLFYPPLPDFTETPNNTQHKTAKGKGSIANNSAWSICLDPLYNTAGIHLPSPSTDMPLIITSALNLLYTKNWPILDPPSLAKLKTSRISFLPASTLDSLKSDKLIKPVPQGLIKSFIHTFPVLKSNSKLRLIGHPAALNDHIKWSTLASVKLGSITQLLLAIDKLLSISSTLSVSESDFRNYFPQIKLPGDTAHFFGILNKDENGKYSSWLMNALCQGWGASPSIAQALSWWAMCKDWPALTLALNNAEFLPGYLQVAQTTSENSPQAIIAIIYDNISVFSTSEAFRDEILARFNKNIGLESLNIEIKYTTLSSNSFAFLGLEGYVSNNRLHWRIQDSQFQQWKTVAQDYATKDKPNPRDAMRLYGFLCRSTHISGDHTYNTRHITRLIADLTRATTSKPAWAVSTQLSRNATVTLATHITQLKNDWSSHSPSSSVSPLAVLTDASMTGLGFTALHLDKDKNWHLLEIRSLPRSNTVSIEEEEALAVLWATDCLAPHFHKHDAILFGIDNRIVSRGLLRGATRSTRADSHIQASLSKLLRAFQAKNIAFADIKSEHNVADIPSRGEISSGTDFDRRMALSKEKMTKAFENLNNNIRWTPR